MGNTAADCDVSGSGEIDYDCDDDFGKDWAESQKNTKVIYMVVYSLVLVLGVLGNGVVIWATGFRMKKTVSTVWYLNLAVADFLVTAFLPLTITKKALDERWPFGAFMCKADAVVFYTNLYASIYVLVVISVDRCVCVVRPVWAQNHRTVRKASWVSLGVWVLAVALSSPHFIFREARTSDHDENILWCEDTLFPAAAAGNHSTPELNKLLRFRRDTAMGVTRLLLSFVLPFVVVVSCYSVLVHRLGNSRSLAGQSRRPVTIIVTVIVVFFLCWAPYHVIPLTYRAAAAEDGSGELYQELFAAATGLALLNSCLNPLLYVFMAQGFRDVFRWSILKVLEKAFAEEPPSSQTTNTSTDKAVTARLETTALSEDPGLSLGVV